MQYLVSEKVTDMVTDKKLLVLKLLIADSSSILAEKLCVSRKTVTDRIKGVIERVRSDRNGYWKIKY